MDKESIYELQKIDCNCNDCGYMERDFSAYKKAEDIHKSWQLAEFEQRKALAIKEAASQNNQSLIKRANNMQFQFDKKGIIKHGNCSKFNKPVTFIENTCQLETQSCFAHRKDLQNQLIQRG